MRLLDRNSDRRNFLRTLVGGLAATAAVRTWPFRVYSFPKEVKTYTSPQMDKYLRAAAESLMRDIELDFYQTGIGFHTLRQQGWKIRTPARYHAPLG